MQTWVQGGIQELSRGSEIFFSGGGMLSTRWGLKTPRNPNISRGVPRNKNSFPRAFKVINVNHQINNNTDSTLDVVFLRFRGFLFYNNPETEAQTSFAHSVQNMPSLCLVIQHCLRVTPLGFCLWVIVNEKLLNLKRRQLSVLLLILGLALKVYA